MTLNARQMFEREFLEIRCRILDIAAALDRVDSANGGGGAQVDPRSKAVQDAILLLVDGQADRSRRVQMVFSDGYEADWRK